MSPNRCGHVLGLNTCAGHPGLSRHVQRRGWPRGKGVHARLRRAMRGHDVYEQLNLTEICCAIVEVDRLTASLQPWGAIMTRQPSNRPMSRRTLVAGVAVMTAALGTETAKAQRCPAVPPPRAKGPLVWLDMDQQDRSE